MKTSMRLLFVCSVCCLLQPSLSQGWQFYFGGNIGKEAITIGIPYIYSVSIKDPPLQFVTLAPLISGSLLVDPPSFSFTPSVMSFNFTLTETVGGRNQDILGWALAPSPDQANYTAPDQMTISIKAREVYLNLGYLKTFPGTPIVGVPTSSFAIGLQLYPPSGGSVTVVPGSDPPNAVSFSPSQFTFSSTPDNLVFNYVSQTKATAVVYWTVVSNGGVDYSLWYQAPANHTVTPTLRSISCSTFQKTMPVGVMSPVYTLSVEYLSGSSITVTPSAPNTKFTPSVINFVSNPTAELSFVTTSIGSLYISFTVGGPSSNWYSPPPSQSVTVSSLTFQVSYDGSATLVPGVSSQLYTITADYPPPSDVVITFGVPASSTAAFVFLPNHVTFTPSVRTNSFQFSTTTAISSQITYTLSGTNAGLYTAPPPANVNVAQLSIVGPNFIKTMNCGDSAVYTVAVSSPPPRGVTVTAYGNGIVFSPSVFNFSPTVPVISFTITATFSGASTITYTLTGEDSALFSAVVSSTVINVVQKTITAPVFDTQLVAGVASPFVMMLKSPPASDLTITPSAAGITFAPPSFVFNKNSPISVAFTATPTIPSSVTISYAISGTDVGCFAPLPPTTVVVSPVYLVTPPLAPLVVSEWSSAYTISILPIVQSSVTITPTGLNLLFDPPSLTLTNTVSSGYFRVQGVQAGSSTVYYNIAGQGPTFEYISPPTPSTITINLRKFTVPTTIPDVYSQWPSQQLIIGVVDVPVTSVTLQPWAPDTVFAPPSLTFDANGGGTTQSFSVVTGSGSVAGIQRQVTWYLSGGDAALYMLPDSVAFTSYLRPLDRTTPIATPTFNVPFVFSISTPIPPSNSLTFTPVGAFTFQPTTVTMSGSSGSVSITATPTLIGASPLKVLVGGPDAALYVPLGDIAVTIKQAAFSVLLPASINLNYGLPSLPIQVMTTAPPITGVTLTITSPQVVVTPSSLSFSPSSIVSSFTITADPSVYTIKTGGSVYFTYTVSGPDAQNFVAAPNSVPVNVHTPYRQFTLSASSLLLYLGQTTSFTVTLVDTPPSSFTLTPTVEESSGIVITPASVIFDSVNYAATFTVTSDYIYPSTKVDFTVSGADGYLYKDCAAAASLTLTFQSGAITSNLPTTIKAGQITVVEFMYLSSLVPTSPITVEPYVISGPSVTFNPPQITLSATAMSARYSVLGNAPGVATVGFLIAGDSSASWFQLSPQTTSSLTVQGLNFVGFSQAAVNAEHFVVGVPSRYFTVNVDYLPPTGVTLTAVSNEVQFPKNQNNFVFSRTPTGGAVSFYFTPLVVSAEKTISIGFSVSGPDAALYITPPTITLPAVLPRSLSWSVPSMFYGGTVYQVTLVAQYPPPTSITFTPLAPGIIFNPTSVTIKAGQSSVSFQAAAITSGLSGVEVTYVVSGPDAAWYSSPVATTVSVGWGVINIPSSVSESYPTYVSVNVNPPPTSLLVVTPVAVDAVFTPPSLLFSASVSSLNFSVASNVRGDVHITYTLSGVNAPFYRLPVETQATVVSFSPLQLLVSRPPVDYVAGSLSQPVVVSSGRNVNYLVVPSDVIYVIPQADVPTTFFPPNITLSALTPTATFAFVCNISGPLTIGFVIGGKGAPSFSVLPSITVTVTQRSFDIAPALFTNTVLNPQSSVFYYGITSQRFVIFVKSVPMNVTLTLVSDKFSFSPSVLQFSPTKPSAFFTMQGTSIGLAVISFVVGGPDASLFTVPAAHTYTRVTYNVAFPVVPSLTVGVSSADQQVKLTPTPITPFILALPSPTSDVVFSPSQLIFPAGVNVASFTVIAYKTTVSLSSQQAIIPGVVQEAVVVTATPYNINVTGRDDGDYDAYPIPLLTKTSVNVVPGMFVLHHPHYQLDVESSVTVEISTAPRSDIVVTVYGNNMLFNPPHVIFTATGPLQQEISVTPLHATSYELDYASFKVNYVCSGSNVNDYLCPSETHHYVALPRLYIAAIIIAIVGFFAVLAIAFILYTVIKSRRSSTRKPTSRPLVVNDSGPPYETESFPPYVTETTSLLDSKDEL